MIADVRIPGDATVVLSRLTELGPASEIRAHAPALAAQALRLDRVVLTSIVDGALLAEAIFAGSERTAADLLARLREQPVALEYPLLEGEMLRRRRAQVVHTPQHDRTTRTLFADALEWTQYIAAPIVLDGRVVGFFHGDRRQNDPELDEHDAADLAFFAACFALVYERAVLRHRLRTQREEMHQIASWADARTGELGDRSVTIAHDASDTDSTPLCQTSGRGENALRDLLTRRELEVLRLMVQGETNAGIARELVVSEGTVKFHVKNILRKMHAANRAEATSRYLRMTLRQTVD
ncbi:hypothetical protein DSM104299_03623 [Baekduia alba]|nr:hypothetical protein DSM104299_03623 [Baekduia alba]